MRYRTGDIVVCENLTWNSNKITVISYAGRSAGLNIEVYKLSYTTKNLHECKTQIILASIFDACSYPLIV